MRCPSCQEPNPPEAIRCENCHRRLPRRRDAEAEPVDSAEEMVSTIIPYKNALALAAYYLGIFGLIPCLGLLLGPAALTLGILGWRRARAHPESKGSAHAMVGIVLGLIESFGNWGVVITLGVLGLGGALK